MFVKHRSFLRGNKCINFTFWASTNYINRTTAVKISSFSPHKKEKEWM